MGIVLVRLQLLGGNWTNGADTIQHGGRPICKETEMAVPRRLRQRGADISPTT